MRDNKNRMNICRCFLLALLLLFVLGAFTACFASDRNSDGILRVHFLDVGQSEASFVEFGDELCMLVDTGDEAHAYKVCSYIKECGYSRIDTLFITHPHADHAGGAARVLESFEVGRILTPRVDYTTPEFDSMIKTAKGRGVETVYVGDGDGFAFGECEALFLSCTDVSDDENDQSAVMKLSFGSRAFLFMADVTSNAEEYFLQSDIDISSDVIKVGHHGSDASSSDELVGAVDAKYAVISCSADNEYSHPSPYTVRRFENSGAVVLATDECSDIVFTTDGDGLSVKCKNKSVTEADTLTRSDGEYLYVLDIQTHTLHKKDCDHIKDENTQAYEKTNAQITSLLAEGYRKCRTCFIKGE